MNTLKRFLCLFLATLLVIPFASCSVDDPANEQSNDTTNADTTKALEVETIYYEEDELPELNFGGESVYILSPASSSNGFSFYETTLTVEELSSDVLNDSIYNRELYVEDRLGVNIENMKTASTDREIEKIINAGDDMYEAFISTNTFISECTINEYLLDLHNVKYLDFDKPWWSQKFIEKAEIFGSLYMATGALFQSLIRSTYAVYYNKNLALDYVESIPELADIYGVIDSGEWTIDKFVEIGGGIYQDINGNSKRDFEDIYGINYVQANPFWSGFDITIFERSDDGWFEFNVDTEKMYAALDKLYELRYDTMGSILANIGMVDDESFDMNHMEKSFTNGTNLFLVERLGYAETDSFRNMQDDYGVLPFPKYDNAQKEYYSLANTSFCAVAIPAFNTSTDAIGAVLEAMASYSYRETRPLHLDTVLKGQYMSDADSRRMVDMVIDGVMIDSAWIYIDSLAKQYQGKIHTVLENEEKSFASAHESAKKNVENVLKVYKKQLQK